MRDTHSPKSKLALVELLRMHGTVLARQRSWDEAERAFEEAVSVAQSVRYPYAEVCSLVVGLMYVDGPDKKRGRERLEEGTEIARRPGSQPYLELLQNAMAGLDCLLEVRMRRLHSC